MYLPIATIITTIFIIIFAEIIPKILATHYAMNIIKKSSILLIFCYFINYPIVLIFSHFSKAIVSFIKLFNKEAKHKMTEDELKEIFNISREDGALVSLEHTLLKKAVHLKKLKIKNIPNEKKENITMHRYGPIRYHDDLGTGNGCHAVWRREE